MGLYLTARARQTAKERKDVRERSMTKRFLIDLAYTDDELAAYARIADSEWRQGADHLAWGIYGSGFAISLIGAFLAFRLNVVTANRVDLIAVLIAVGFFLGMWSPSIWYGRLRRARIRAQASRGSLLVTEHGLFVRRAGARGFASRQAIASVAIAGVLMVIRQREGRPLAVPARRRAASTASRAGADAPNKRAASMRRLPNLARTARARQRE